MILPFFWKNLPKNVIKTLNFRIFWVEFVCFDRMVHRQHLFCWYLKWNKVLSSKSFLDFLLCFWMYNYELSKNEDAFKPFTNWFLIRKLVLIYYLVILYVYWKIFQINAPTRSGMYITQKCYAHMLQLTVDSVETGNPSLTFSDTLLKQALRTM